VFQLLSGKLALKYNGKDLDAMRAIAQAVQKRSLSDFQSASTTYQQELGEDVVVKAHLATMYDKMMEQNLCRIIEPYSKVEVLNDTIRLCINIVLQLQCCCRVKNILI